MSIYFDTTKITQSNNVVICDKEMTIGGYELTDLNGLYLGLSNKETCRGLGCNTIRAKGALKTMIENNIKHHNSSQSDCDRLAIRVDGEYIGNISIYAKGDRVEIGYFIIKNWQGKGYGARAVKAITEYLRSRDYIVSARVQEWNTKSIQILESVGYKFKSYGFDPVANVRYKLYINR